MILCSGSTVLQEQSFLRLDIPKWSIQKLEHTGKTKYVTHRQTASYLPVSFIKKRDSIRSFGARIDTKNTTLPAHLNEIKIYLET